MLASRVLAARTVARQQRRGIVDYLTKWPDTVGEVMDMVNWRKGESEVYKERVVV
jgi:hypothetical protein